MQRSFLSSRARIHLIEMKPYFYVCIALDCRKLLLIPEFRKFNARFGEITKAPILTLYPCKEEIEIVVDELCDQYQDFNILSEFICIQPISSLHIKRGLQWFILKIVLMGTVYPSGRNQWVTTQMQWVKIVTKSNNYECEIKWSFIFSIMWIDVENFGSLMLYS